MFALTSAFTDAGLPEGVLNFLVHEPSPSTAAQVTRALIEHPLVRKINFTGSTAVGRIIGKLAGENLKPIVLELGGKAPAIIWEDADLDSAAEQCAVGAYLHGGQICMSTDKILVHKNVKAEFEEKFATKAKAMFGPQFLINAAAVEKTQSLLKDAVGKGARIVAGEVQQNERPTTQAGPVVLADISTDMDIYYKETFGPAVTILSFETEEEALKMANDTEYGLSSAVFTEDLRRGLRFARKIESGAVHINRMTVHDESSLPHGGVKASGFGRFNSSAGLQEWVKTKTITWRV